MICEICKKELKSINSLSKHLRYNHNISSQGYYDRYFRNYSSDDGFCFECGKETKFKNINIGYLNFCSIKCSRSNKRTQNKMKQTCLERYGVENPIQSEKIQEKNKRNMFRTIWR